MSERIVRSPVSLRRHRTIVVCDDRSMIWRRLGRGRQPRVDAVVFDLRRTIAAHGWAVMHVPDDDPPFHYTVGLTDRDLPELIVFGCEAELGHDLLNDLAGRLLDGQIWQDGAPVRELTEGDVALELHAVTVSAPVGVALLYYGRPVSVRQLVLPDASGRFPWEPGAEDPFAPPLLFAHPA